MAENGNINNISAKNLGPLVEVASIINSSLDLDKVLTLILNAVNKIIHAEASSTLLIDQYHQNLYFNATTGEKAKQIKKFTLHLGEGIAGWVAKTG